jgi:hypothetical protein
MYKIIFCGFSLLDIVFEGMMIMQTTILNTPLDIGI